LNEVIILMEEPLLKDKDFTHRSHHFNKQRFSQSPDFSNREEGDSEELELKSLEKKRKILCWTALIASLSVLTALYILKGN